MAPLDGERPFPAATRAEERLGLRVEPGGGHGAREVREVIAPLAVAGRVVDDAVDHLDLADREVALEVRRVVERVPEAEFHRAEERQHRGLLAAVGDGGAPELECLAERDEVERLDLDPRAAPRDHRVAEPVAAAVAVELAARGLPRRRPEVARVVVPDVQIAAAPVERHVVVAVSGEAPQARVVAEGVAARRVRDEREVVLGAQVVEPRERCVGPLDHVLAGRVVEVAEAHRTSLLSRARARSTRARRAASRARRAGLRRAGRRSAGSGG